MYRYALLGRVEEISVRVGSGKVVSVHRYALAGRVEEISGESGSGDRVFLYRYVEVGEVKEILGRERKSIRNLRKHNARRALHKKLPVNRKNL